MTSRLPTNPFKFGDPVQGDYYLSRLHLENFVTQFLVNRIHVVLIGPRRFGKTSFLFNLLENLKKQSHSYIYVDIFSITSHRDFLHQLLRALKSSFDLSLDITHSNESDVKEMIQDVLASLGQLGDGLILAIDEFQKITEIGDQGWLEATLRTHMQQLRNTSFIFTGSRRGIIYDMLNNPSRPLYKFCQPIEFPAFGDEFTDWILDRFRKVGINCQKNSIEHLNPIGYQSHVQVLNKLEDLRFAMKSKSETWTKSKASKIPTYLKPERELLVQKAHVGNP